MPRRDLRPQSVGRDPPGRVAIESESAGDRLAEQGVAERRENEPQGAFWHVMLFVADPKLSDEIADGIEDRVQRVAVAGQDHPCGKRAGAFAVEGVERAVDHLADVALADPGALDGLGDASRHSIRDRSGELRLQPGGRAEMMEQVSMGTADLRSDGLEGHGLRAIVQKKLARGLQRG